MGLAVCKSKIPVLLESPVQPSPGVCKLGHSAGQQVVREVAISCLPLLALGLEVHTLLVFSTILTFQLVLLASV